MCEGAKTKEPSTSVLTNVTARLLAFVAQLNYVQYDFNNTDPSVLATFKSAFAAALTSVSSAGILVNNVGLSNENPEYVHLIPQDEVDQMLNVNNGGTVLMSRLVLPDMVKRRKGAVITVSSAR